MKKPSLLKRHLGFLTRLPKDEKNVMNILEALFDMVIERQNISPSLSHSARLISKGKKKIAQKFGEESVEYLIEILQQDKEEILGESADILYHLVILWVDAKLKKEDIRLILQEAFPAKAL